MDMNDVLGILGIETVKAAGGDDEDIRAYADSRGFNVEWVNESDRRITYGDVGIPDEVQATIDELVKIGLTTTAGQIVTNISNVPTSGIIITKDSRRRTISYGLGVQFFMRKKDPKKEVYTAFINRDKLIADLKWIDDGPLKITSTMMSNFGWSVTSSELSKINSMLQQYGINNTGSIQLFMATCGHESGKGNKTLEGLNPDGTVVGTGYGPNDRGAGYIQITTRSTHLEFLKTVNDSFSGANTAKHISDNYPWEAAGWYWSKYNKSSEGNLNAYVGKYGDTENVFLITQYIVNKWQSALDDNNRGADIRDGKVSWDIINEKLFINNIEICPAPKGWGIQITGRKDCYYKALNVFK